MNDKDLFVIIRAILWFNPDISMPSDKEIIKFIEFAKKQYEEEN